MKAFLPKDQLPLLLDALGERIEVIAPVSTDAGPAFVTWHGQPIDLKDKPLSPITEFLLPHKEALFTYIQEAGRYTFKEEEIPSRLLFGIRPCDLHAIALLDRIFGREPPDQAYLRRRRATALVVQNCTSPGKECFCAGLEAGPEAKRSVRPSTHRHRERISMPGRDPGRDSYSECGQDPPAACSAWASSGENKAAAKGEKGHATG